jgi:biopolymer transport protein ExbD
MKWRRRPLDRRNIRQGEANVIPLIDVLMVLIVFFLVIFAFLTESGIFVSSPVVSAAGAPGEQTELKVNIHITKDGQYILNDEVVEYDKLEYLVSELLKRSAERRVVLSADPEVIHDKVVGILDMAKQHGATQLAILKRSAAPTGGGG